MRRRRQPVAPTAEGGLSPGLLRCTRAASHGRAEAKEPLRWWCRRSSSFGSSRLPRHAHFQDAGARRAPRSDNRDRARRFLRSAAAARRSRRRRPQHGCSAAHSVGTERACANASVSTISGAEIEEEIERRPAARPVDAGLHGGARRHPYRGDPAAAQPRRQSGRSPARTSGSPIATTSVSANSVSKPRQYSSYVSAYASERTDFDIDAQRRVVSLGNAGDVGEAVEVRAHHHRNEGDRHSELPAARSLLVDHSPVAGAALRVVLDLVWMIKREFDVLEGDDLCIAKHLD